MNDENAKVSIIIPSYNHKPYIGLLVESIYNQTYKNFELIIVDDGSKDGSAEYLPYLANKYQFQLVLKENEGLCKTLNKGLSLATGKYIITIGSDDIMPSCRLEEQVSYLEKNPNVEVVGGCMNLIDEQGKDCGKKIPAIIGKITFSDLIVTNRVFAPTAMMRASVFKKCGLYPPEYLLEDYYLWLKLLSLGGTIHNTSHFWADYRISNVNLEKKINWYYKGAVQALTPYQSLPSVDERLRRNHVLYCIKLTLLMGSKFRISYAENFVRLDRFEKMVVTLVALIPHRIRDFLLIRLKLKV